MWRITHDCCCCCFGGMHSNSLRVLVRARRICRSWYYFIVEVTSTTWGAAGYTYFSVVVECGDDEASASGWRTAFRRIRLACGWTIITLPKTLQAAVVHKHSSRDLLSFLSWFADCLMPVPHNHCCCTTERSRTTHSTSSAAVWSSKPCYHQRSNRQHVAAG